jgi:hypothetical protein
MKRLASTAALIATVGIIAPALRADVKTQERTVTNLAGMMGAAAGMFGGGAAKDGVISTLAVKGSRKLSINDTTGTIIDLAEQKVYTLDVKRKQYTVQTFDQRREQMNTLRDDAQRRSQQMPASNRQQAQDTAKQMETDFDLKETGQHKQIAGYDAHEVIMTVTTHEKGRKVEDSGGNVMTTAMWIAPKIAALDEIAQFDAKYAQLMYGPAAASSDPQQAAQQAAQMAAMYPSMAAMNERMAAERGKTAGTQLVATVTFEMVQSAEAVKAAAGRASSSSGGGSGSGGSSGLGAILGRRMGGDPSQPRTTVMTTVRELVSIATATSAADVAIPAGYTEKK